MTVMITEVWDALRSVGVEDEKARRAAEAVADHRAGLNERVDAGFAETERRDNALRLEMRDEIGGLRQEMRDEIGGLRQEMRDEIGGLRQEMRDEIGGLRQEMRDGDAALRGDVQLLKWMVGATFAGVVAILLRLFL